MAVSSALSFQAFGLDNASTIVFLHGGGVGRWMWQPVIRELPEYHCLAPDQPEHGGSRHLGPFNMDLAAAKVADLIRDHAHGGKACVVGVSEGAQVTVQLLATVPELVDKAMVSSALLRPIPWLWCFRSRTLLAWLYRLSIPPFRNSDWWIRLNMKYAAGIPHEFFAYFRKDFREMTETEFVNLMIASQRFRLLDSLSKATAPTLVVAGHREYAAMKQSVRDLVAALPRAKGGLVNLGRKTAAQEHSWALTAPRIFAATIRAWIEDKTLPEEIQEW
jgi:pimeloyl-ACP methyl ester carboxylesterase